MRWRHGVRGAGDELRSRASVSAGRHADLGAGDPGVGPHHRRSERRRVSPERRRRQRHFARRRRDLIEDTGVALAVSLVLVVFTAGLGVLALLMMALVAAIAGSVIAQRVITSRRARSGSGSAQQRRR